MSHPTELEKEWINDNQTYLSTRTPANLNQVLNFLKKNLDASYVKEDSDGNTKDKYYELNNYGDWLNGVTSLTTFGAPATNTDTDGVVIVAGADRIQTDNGKRTFECTWIDTWEETDLGKDWTCTGVKESVVEI